MRHRRPSGKRADGSWRPRQRCRRHCGCRSSLSWRSPCSPRRVCGVLAYVHMARVQPVTARISGAQRSSIGRIASAFAAGRLITTRAMPRSRNWCSRSRSSGTRNRVTGSDAGSRPARSRACGTAAAGWLCRHVLGRRRWGSSRRHNAPHGARRTGMRRRR